MQRDRPRIPRREPETPTSATNGHDPAWQRNVGQPELPEGAPTWRLFVALKLPEAAIEEVATFINAMPTMAAGNVRWTRRENVHLTLLFLGDTPTEMAPAVQECIQQAASNTSPFRLRLGETGAFPSFHAPKILWVGLQGEVRKLMQLQGRVEGNMKTLGFRPERRPFSPHITVGRAVRDLSPQYAGDVGFSWRRSVLPQQRAEVPVNEIHLIRSTLQPGGAVYEDVFTATLGS